MLILHLEEKENKILISKEEFGLILDQLRKIDEVRVVQDETADLLEASSTSLAFWDNEIDDRVWNEA